MKKIIKKSESVQELYGKTASFLLGEAILFAIIAIFIFFKPLEILTTITFIFGIALSVFGIYQTYLGLFGKEKNPTAKIINVIFGVINIIIGAAFFLHPATLLFALLYIFAALFLFKAIKSLIISIKMCQEKFGHYIISILVSLAMAALAILMLMFPAVSAVTAMYYIAFILLFYAIADFYMYTELKKLGK